MMLGLRIGIIFGCLLKIGIVELGGGGIVREIPLSWVFTVEFG